MNGEIMSRSEKYFAKDRRQYKRYHAMEGIYVIFGKYSSKLGRLVNISRGGVCVRYNDNRKRSNGSFNLSILISDDNGNSKEYIFYAKTVADYEVFKGTRFIFPERECHIEFSNLMAHQIEEIEEIREVCKDVNKMR